MTRKMLRVFTHPILRQVSIAARWPWHIELVSWTKYVSGEHFSSYSGMSPEEFLLVLLKQYHLLFSLQTSAPETCLESNNSDFLPEEVIANSPPTHSTGLSHPKASKTHAESVTTLLTTSCVLLSQKISEKKNLGKVYQARRKNTFFSKLWRLRPEIRSSYALNSCTSCLLAGIPRRHFLDGSSFVSHRILHDTRNSGI
jgi:hypothetical protein